MTGADFAGLFPNYLWIDLEASSLSVNSWPVEFGWCSADLCADSFLIRPMERWSDWSVMSEMIHGISRETLRDRGIDAEQAAREINRVCHGRQVLSDNPQADADWLRQLFHDVGVRQDFVLQDSRQLENMAAVMSKLALGEAQGLQDRVKSAFPHPHRAGPDARREVARFLALAKPEEIEAILALA